MGSLGKQKKSVKSPRQQQQQQQKRSMLITARDNTANSPAIRARSTKHGHL